MRGAPQLSIERESEFLITGGEDDAMDAFPHRRCFRLRNISHSFIVEKSGDLRTSLRVLCIFH